MTEQEYDKLRTLLHSAKCRTERGSDAEDIVEELQEKIEGMYFGRVIEKRAVDADKQQWQAIKGFVESRLAFVEDAFVPNTELYTAWRSWSKDLTIKQGSALKNNAFSRALGEYLFTIEADVRRARVQPIKDGKKSSVYGWSGLHLIPLPTPGGVTVEESLKDSPIQTGQIPQPW